MLNNLNAGKTIEEAIQFTLENMTDTYSPTYGIEADYPIVYIGDVTQTIN